MAHDRFLEKPRYCCWVLNYRCMLRCRMCYIWNIHDDSAAETTMEQKKQFVRSLRGFVDPGFEFHLSGGEPLLTEGIWDLVNFISAEGYRTNLVTNGFLVDAAMASQIAASGLDSLTFSLDGINPATHDFIRGVPGSAARIMRAIELVDASRRNRKPAISIISLIMERNLNELLALADWVDRDDRLGMISFQAITQPFCEEMNSAWFTRESSRLLWPQDPARAGWVMEQLRARRLAGRKIGNHPNHFLHFREYFKDPNTFLKKIKCTLGDYEFHVDPYGKAFFCCLTEPFGNIKADLLPQIWSSAETQQIRRDVYGCKRNCHIMINCFYEEEPALQADRAPEAGP